MPAIKALWCKGLDGAVRNKTFMWCAYKVLKQPKFTATSNPESTAASIGVGSSYLASGVYLGRLFMTARDLRVMAHLQHAEFAKI